MIFALFILCNIVSVLVIVFSHGVYQDYASKIISDDSNWESKWVEYDPEISFGNITDTVGDENITNYYGDGKSTLGELRQVLDLLDDKTKSSFTGFYMYYKFEDPHSFEAETDNNMTITSSDGDLDEMGNFHILMSRIEYDSTAHQYGLYSSLTENIHPLVGRYITQQEELEGKPVIYLPPDSDTNLLGKTVEFLGMKLEVIGIDGPKGMSDYIVPFKILPDDLTFSTLSFLVDKPITTDTYRKIKVAFESVYGDNVNFPDFETVDPAEQTFYASIMLISIALSVLSAINLAILFRYIMHTRRKTLAILRLSGCTRIKVRIMYLAEVAGISIIIFAICSALYNYLIMPRLTFAFPKIQEVYNIKTYLYLFAIFIVILLAAINIIFSLKVEKQPVDMLKKAGDK